MKNYRYRDFTVLAMKDETMVMACDAAGAIGSKVNDLLKVHMEQVAYVTSMVVLKELITIGAKPISIMNGIINEMHPTGQEALKGIQKTLDEYGSDEPITINGSTEENFTTHQSGISIVMVGKLMGDLPKVSKEHTLLVLLGRPLVGEEVIEQSHLALDLSTLRRVRDMIDGPMYMVGSQGIKGEVEQIEAFEKVKVTMSDKLNVDIHKSGGPGTSCICMVTPEEFEQLIREIRCPLGQIGECNDLH